jgi:hypothetical protein
MRWVRKEASITSPDGVQALKTEYLNILDDAQFEPTIGEIWRRKFGLMRRLRVLAGEWIKEVNHQYSMRRLERYPRRHRGSVDWSERDATALAALPLAAARLTTRFPVVRITGLSLRREAGVRHWSPQKMPLSSDYIRSASEPKEAFYERSVLLCAEHISSTGVPVTYQELFKLAGRYPMAHLNRHREELLDKLCEQAIWDTSTHVPFSREQRRHAALLRIAEQSGNWTGAAGDERGAIGTGYRA